MFYNLEARFSSALQPESREQNLEKMSEKVQIMGVKKKG